MSNRKNPFTLKSKELKVLNGGMPENELDQLDTKHRILVKLTMINPTMNTFSQQNFLQNICCQTQLQLILILTPTPTGQV